MNARTHRILNDPTLLAARERHFGRLARIFAGCAPDSPFLVNGLTGCSRPRPGAPDQNGSMGLGGGIDPYTEPEVWVAEALDSLAERADVLLDPDVFRPLCLEFGPYGVHFVDRMFGANVSLSPEGQWWVDYLDRPIGSLELPDLDRESTWKLARRLAMAFQDAGVSVPLFGLPTIASALNIGVNLYGPALLAGFYEAPEAVRRDLATINDLLCALHRWYRANLPESQLQPVVAAERCQPPGHGQLCGCTTHLLSAAMYEECVAPLDEALLSVYPNGGMIHLCGRHTQHIPAWRRMRALRAVQLNDRATEDFETYYDGLRDDQVLYIIPTESVTVEKVLARTGGRRVVLIGQKPA